MLPLPACDAQIKNSRANVKHAIFSYRQFFKKMFKEIQDQKIFLCGSNWRYCIAFIIRSLRRSDWRIPPPSATRLERSHFLNPRRTSASRRMIAPAQRNPNRLISQAETELRAASRTAAALRRFCRKPSNHSNSPTRQSVERLYSVFVWRRQSSPDD